MKKSVGIIVLVVGVLLAAFGFYQNEASSKTLIQIGKTEINTQKNDPMTNPLIIGGGVVAIIGLVVVVVAKK
ncbi:DUF3185 family protein [Bernardetia sp.]|uniref:DUF3185 family protein n=1 Tax=Bernardetia sp. TaxID=1937974 RepID=UPI0025C179DD|nr:DUF3185 family protein [Bernardetia sp.]